MSVHALEAALSDPWGALRTVIDGPLHPGGIAATDRLLDRADVTAGTRVLDLGCGAGEALAVAAARGADPVGLDRDPAAGQAAPGPVLRGDLQHLPVRDGTVDVAISECTLCLSPDLDRTLTDVRRVLTDGGRLALSDVVVDGDLPAVPPALAEALCLTGARDRDRLLDRIEGAGFTIQAVHDHREALLAMRDDLADRIDYRGLLGALGRADIADAVGDLEAAVEDGTVGYVSLVATPA